MRLTVLVFTESAGDIDQSGAITVAGDVQIDIQGTMLDMSEPPKIETKGRRVNYTSDVISNGGYKWDDK